MHYLRNKFSKIATLQFSPLIFDFGDLKLCDLAKL